jgi:hypothetical protein
MLQGLSIFVTKKMDDKRKIRQELEPFYLNEEKIIQDPKENNNELLVVGIMYLSRLIISGVYLNFSSKLALKSRL